MTVTGVEGQRPEQRQAPGVVAAHGRAVVLWRSGEDEASGDRDLQGLGGEAWTVRIRDGRNWKWDQVEGRLDVRTVLAHLDRLPSVRVRVWSPALELGALLVSADSTSRPQTLAAWQPFPSSEHAGLHQACWEADQGVSTHPNTLRSALEPLGGRVPSSWSARDPGYWVGRSDPALVRAALALALERRVHVELLGATLTGAGFDQLDPVGAEIAAGLAAEWHRSAADLVEAAKLLA